MNDHTGSDNRFAKRLRRALTSKDMSVQNAALRQLLDMGPDAIGVLRPILQSEVRLIRYGHACHTFFVASLCFSPLLKLAVGRPWEFDDYLRFAAGILVLPLRFWLDRPRGNDLTRAISDAACRVSDVRSIPLLIDLWPTESDPARIRLALIDLLPCVNAADAVWFGASVRIRLCRLLMEQGEAPLQLAIMNAPGRVGGAESIPLIERLGAIRGDNPWQVQLRAGAVECLACIGSRLELARVGAHLLRATELDESSDKLLRPASAIGACAAGDLLIPACVNQSKDCGDA